MSKEERSLVAFSKALDNMTPEEHEAIMKKVAPEDKTPKGWVSIEDALPHWMLLDVEEGYSTYKVKYKDGRESESRVTDHQTWYYMAKDAGVTHWWND